MLEWLATVATESSTADLLRLAAVPVFGWAAYRDVSTRRVPNRAWLPLAVLGVVVLVWEAWRVSSGVEPGIYDAVDKELYFLRVALSLGLVGSVGYLFYWFGGFGGADAKALIVLAVVFPTFPTYTLPETTLPLHETTVGVFSLTILTNTVLVGVVYPLAVAVRNALAGRVAPVMLIGRPIRATEATEKYGSLLQTPEGYTRRGLDLDALRMYLRWRGCTLTEIRADPDAYRDPASLPDDPNPPGDGSVPLDEDASTDGGVSADEDASTDGSVPPDCDISTDGSADFDDPWGAAAFLDDIEGDAYGTRPEQLREGLEVLASEDVVWFSPGLPFIVPMFLGLVVSLVYGDLFTQVAAAFA